MKRLIGTAAFLILVSACTAQNGKDEQEVRAFLAEYDKAVSSRDIAFLERALPEDYVFTGESGKRSDRAGVLNFFKRKKAEPANPTNTLKHENVNVRVVGNMAVVTNDYTAQTRPIDVPGAEPQTFRGRHTGVFEKRDGRWMVIAEQDTEQLRDAGSAEQQVEKAAREYLDLMKRLKSGRSYAELEKSGDIAALKRFLTDDYISTGGNGEIANKTETLESYKTNRIRLESADVSDQKVLAIDHNAAIETGKIRYVGTNAGKPFDVTQRYTTTWVFWGESWQVTAHHTSTVK